MRTNMSQIKILLNTVLKILLLCIAGYSAQSWASCTSQGQYAVNTPLQLGTVSAGEDMPVGTVIVRQRIIGYATVIATCSGSGTPYVWPVFNLSGGNLYAGQTNIYQTGVAGLGVQFRQVYDNRYYPYTGYPVDTGRSEFYPSGYLSFDIEFVKMGSITPGSINTRILPQVQIQAKDNGPPIRVAYHTITGSITVQATTCTTPDYTYDLGSYKNTTFSGKGSASPWVDTPVTLTNCPKLWGNHSNGALTQYQITGMSSGNVTSQGGLAQNSFTMTFAPNVTVIDAANGIIGLDNTSTAKGIGVQLGSKQSGSYIPQNLSGNIVISKPVNDNSGLVSFPLSARIIQTDNSVSVGTIRNGVVYTISYK